MIVCVPCNNTHNHLPLLSLSHIFILADSRLSLSQLLLLFYLAI